MTPPLATGRDLDARIAERVFGLVRCEGKHHDWSYPNTYCYALPESPEHGGELPAYSFDLHAAWEIIGKLRENHTVTLVLPPTDASDWSCEFKELNPRRPKEYRYHYAVAPSAPEAICLAALKAVGG